MATWLLPLFVDNWVTQAGVGNACIKNIKRLWIGGLQYLLRDEEYDGINTGQTSPNIAVYALK